MPETNQSTREKWDSKHANASGVGEISQVLLENRHLLPVRGDALDFACGRGANALELSRCGLNVKAWDISSVALQRLDAEASKAGLPVTTEARDLGLNPPPGSSFDVIVASHFLDRNLVSSIQNALRPGGLLFYQTFNQSSSDGPQTKSFHLKDNELLSLFPDLKLRVYRDEAALGDLTLGWRGLSMMVAER